MSTKYAVYDPKTGENTIVEYREDAVKLFWQRMIELARPYFHDTAYMTIEVNEETGAETWYNDAGQVIDRPRTAAEIQAQLEEFRLNNSTSMVNADGSSS